MGGEGCEVESGGERMKVEESGGAQEDFVRVIPTSLKETQLVESERKKAIRLSIVDVAAGIALQEGGLVATGRNGYRTVRRKTRTKCGLSSPPYTFEKMWP
jgi:hypothetical protein